MAQQLWSQDIFSKGEISPLMYARVSVAPYYNGLKTAMNVITYPQGAAGKRFGTEYQATVSGVTDANQVFFKSMQYLNECIYLIVFIPDSILIYLEGILVQTVTSTGLGANVIRDIDYTIIDNVFRVTTGVYAPQDLKRAGTTPNQMTVIDLVDDIITLTTPDIAGRILPVRFSFAGGGAILTTSPQVMTNKTYFIKMLTTTTAKIYASAPNAKAGIKAFDLISAGTGNQFVTILNTWSIASSAIAIYPTFDFNGVDYSTFTITPGGLTGFGITFTSSSALFTAANVGGTINAGTQGGLARIMTYISPTQVTANILINFVALTPIPGSLVIITEPAWSNTRGWPRVCSSFQNRAFFANTDLLPNGLWGSVINDFLNFDDSELDADYAISWYPTSDDINYIRFIVPYRSLTIHTNSGVFSTPLSVETAITPSNFSMTLQDSTPAEAVQPRGIDNQIVILSGNDAHSLLWDGFNNAYQSNIISIANEQLIRNPVDEAAFVDLNRAGSRYMLIINELGSLAIYQTLISEDVMGFTPAILEQPYGNAYFRWVTTSFDGRGWFFTEREIGTAGAPIAITAYTSTTLTAVASAFSLTLPTAFNVTTTGILPVSSPQLAINVWYWAIGVTADTFSVYETQADALAGINPFTFTSAGTTSNIVPYKLVTNFMIEELSFDLKVDCAYTYNPNIGAAADTFAGLPRFNAQNVQIQGDGFGFDYVGINDTVKTIAHNIPTDVATAQMGLPIHVVIQPLPLSIFQGQTKASDLLTPKHIRFVNYMFSDTIGGEVNGVPISMSTFSQVQIGSPPVPVNGIFEQSLMESWDDFTSTGITITHSAPFDIKLIGIFYKVDV